MKQKVLDKTRIPLVLIIPFFILTALPFFLQAIFGLDVIFPKQAHYFFSYAEINSSGTGFSLLEWSAFLIAFFSAILAFIQYRLKNDISTPIIGMALFFSGCLDLFYIFAINRWGIAVVNMNAFIPFTWLIMRIFFILILIIGIALIYCRKSLNNQLSSSFGKRSDFIFVLLASIVLGVFAFFIIYSCAKNPYLPNIYAEKTALWRPWEHVQMILLLIAALFVFPNHYKRHPSYFSQGLVICVLPALSAQIAITVGSQSFMDEYMYIASYLKLITYLPALMGVMLDYIATYQDERLAGYQLQKSLRSVKKQKSELEKVNLELDSFVYMASHDLKTPLRSIGSYADFLTEDYAASLDAEGLAYVSKIQRATTRLQALIENLMTLSRTSRIKNPKETVNVTRIIHEIVEEQKENVNASVDIKIIDDLPDIFCDKIKIRELFSSFIGNAVKFTLKESNPVVEIGYIDQGKKHCFFIKDNGVGIPKAYQKQIFGLFKRLHNYQDYQGTGLGLNIAKRIVDSHKGKIWLESVEGEGTTFYFSLTKK